MMQIQKTRWVEALTGNYATAYAVKAADVDVIAVYPITPQTTIVEKLSEFVANGELNAELIHVESEHSALSAVVGASAPARGSSQRHPAKASSWRTRSST